MASGRHVLELDGSTASRPGRTYGFFEAGVSIDAGTTNVLGYTSWMPRIDTAHGVRIPSPTLRETVVTTPRIPGLEVRLPANTVIRDHDGRIVRELSLTPIPVDRPPFPLPEGVDVPVYFTIQPGGAYCTPTVRDRVAHGSSTPTTTRSIPASSPTSGSTNRTRRAGMSMVPA